MNKKGFDGYLLVPILIFSIIAVFFIFLFFALIFVSGIGASKGQHTGIVTAVEQNDNIFWDANIVYFKTSDQTTQEDKYCVDDLDIKKELEQVAREKKIVTIKFENNFFFMKWECNGGISIITAIT